MPADPFEAELLMMAEMVAEDKKDVPDSSDSEPDDNEPAPSPTACECWLYRLHVHYRQNTIYSCFVLVV